MDSALYSVNTCYSVSKKEECALRDFALRKVFCENRLKFHSHDEIQNRSFHFLYKKKVNESLWEISLLQQLNILT